MQINTRLFAAAILAASTFATQATATEILTTGYTAWKATVTGTPTDADFTGIRSSGNYSTSAGYSLPVGSFGPVAVSGPDGTGYSLIGNSYSYGSYNLTTLQGSNDGTGSMTFTTPTAGLTAFLLYVGETGTLAPVTLSLSDGETFTLNPAIGGLATVGLSSGTAITSFTLTTTAGSQVQLADFWAGNTNQALVTTTPDTPAVEGATFVLIGIGLMVIGARRRVFSNLSQANA